MYQQIDIRVYDTESAGRWESIMSGNVSYGSQFDGWNLWDVYNKFREDRSRKVALMAVQAIRANRAWAYDNQGGENGNWTPIGK
jgi:hypothetical protein